MNSKGLYLAINDIDEDLIEEALYMNKAKMSVPIKRYLTIAACLCFVLVGGLFTSRTGTSVHINQLMGATMQAKVDGDYVVRTLDKNELLTYFDNYKFNDYLEDFRLDSDHDHYSFLVSEDGRIFDDTSQFVYKNDTQIIELKLSKLGLYYGDVFISEQVISPSTIKGKEVTIGTYIDFTFDEDVVEINKYVAELKFEDVYVNITGQGFSEEDFIDLIKIIIDQQSD